MPPLKRTHISPTDAEDAAIEAGIAADPDTMEVTDDMVLRPYKTRGRPKLANPKRAVKLRLDPDVIEGFRKTGPGWQSRINQALRDALDRHRRE